MATILQQAAQKAAAHSYRELHGVVISSGLMSKTVKVRVGGQKWNNFVKKYFPDPKTYLVHDPRDSARTGDVVLIAPGWRTSKTKRHVISKIIGPAQVPIEERPPVPTAEERWAEKISRKEEKDERRANRWRAAGIEKTMQRADKWANKAEWELERIRKVMIQRDPDARMAARVDIMAERAAELLRKGVKLLSKAERTVGRAASEAGQ